MMFAIGLVFVGCASSPADQAPADLSEAVAGGDLARVRELLDGGADPELPIVSGLTPLMRAANRDHGPIVRALLAAGANVDNQGADGLTPLHIAAIGDSAEALGALLDADADAGLRSMSGMNALDYAASSGSASVIEILLMRTALDVNSPSDVITQGHGYPRDRGPTPLGLTAREGQIEAMNKLLDLGADVDAPSASGHTPLLIAIFLDSSPEAVETLLDAGADPEASASCDEGCSVGGGEPLTAIEWALALDRREMFPLLERHVPAR